MRAAAVVGLVACLATACSAAPDEPAGDDEGALEARNIALSLADDGAGLALDDSPRLKAGASATLACGAPFEGTSGKRYACKRGSEKLELLLRNDDATLLYKDGSAKRELFACEKSRDRLTCATKRATSSGGGLASPFASTLAGVHIPNAHAIEGSSYLFRGMAPRSAAELDELQHAGIAAVLLFKNPTGNGSDVDDEKADLAARGIDGAKFLHVPFRWKDLPAFKESCEQTVEALRFLAARERARQKTYFHCTVGEDRTGLLAAMARLVRAPESDPRELFQREMCERGYGSGNPQKPFTVTNELDTGLTPLYRKLAFMVKSGALSSASPDPSACANEPSASELAADEAFAATAYRCGTSTAYAP